MRKFIKKIATLIREAKILLNDYFTDQRIWSFLGTTISVVLVYCIKKYYSNKITILEIQRHKDQEIIYKLTQEKVASKAQVVADQATSLSIEQILVCALAGAAVGVYVVFKILEFLYPSSGNSPISTPFSMSPPGSPASNATSISPSISPPGSPFFNPTNTPTPNIPNSDNYASSIFESLSAALAAVFLQLGTTQALSSLSSRNLDSKVTDAEVLNKMAEKINTTIDGGLVIKEGEVVSMLINSGPFKGLPKISEIPEVYMLDQTPFDAILDACIHLYIQTEPSISPLLAYLKLLETGSCPGA
jgi:hypothetical protein